MASFSLLSFETFVFSLLMFSSELVKSQSHEVEKQKTSNKTSKIRNKSGYRKKWRLVESLNCIEMNISLFFFSQQAQLRYIKKAIKLASSDAYANRMFGVACARGSKLAYFHEMLASKLAGQVAAKNRPCNETLYHPSIFFASPKIKKINDN
ncbi:hypothetical protein BpHYR1_005668 [Brachionus plicatilis]|uniref:Uncharacterized protein n=1 Tax=Brachionus plicatilis TaxID=10195 RepID=A0A3M7Q0R1_BRAPC|nr:hypothetical protein BpHYR1_005668 [Brachionus plicatilis]